MPDFVIQALAWVLAWAQYGFLGVLGGLASYFYPPSTDPRFAWKAFLGKLVCSFFIGKLAGEFISDLNTYKSGTVMLLGFFAYPVLAVLEIRVKGMVENYNPRGPP